MIKSFVHITFLVLVPFLTPAQKIVSITIDGSINPASAAYIHRGIVKANAEKAQCLLIHLNTPGGLLKSTRVIVGDILASPTPIVVYISPAGAHAGSAGVFISMSAHIAAMAPGTNIGAAHPVGMQGQVDTVMNEKTTNDAAAFIRTIAQQRNRNISWAENAVRYSISITASEAVEQKVIDLVAATTSDLLDSLNGRRIQTSAGISTLQTKAATVEEVNMSFVEKLLNIISDPNIAYILMLLGMYGIIFELYNPGSILPGIVGVISLILAFYSMHMLPVNYAGLALIIFAIILFLLEIKVVSHGMLAIGGIASLLMGSLMLIRPGSALEPVSLSRAVIFPAVIVTALFFLFIVGMGLKAQRAKPVTGPGAMIGETGVSLEALAPEGTIRIHGEIWKAETMGDPISPGTKVQVIDLQNWKLKVKPINT